MKLTHKVLIGGVLGILVGLLFGEYCSYLKPVGKVYILSIELAAYPYIITMLISSLGRLQPSFAKKLLQKSWWTFFVVVSVSGLVLTFFGQLFPVNISAVSTGQGSQIMGLLSLFIPSNFFSALTENHVPAVILFCIIFGILLQPIEGKHKLLPLLDIISQICLDFWKWLVGYMHIAVFFLLAATVGGIDMAKISILGEFLALFFLASAILTFWIIPRLISCFVPITYTETFSIVGRALAVAVATTLSVAALPFVAVKVKEWIDEKHGGAHIKGRGEVVDTLLFVSYPIAQIGNYMVYLFVIFAAYYFNDYLFQVKYHVLPFIAYFATIGTSNSIASGLNFITEWLPLNNDTLPLYFGIMPLLKYPQVLVSVMGYTFVTLVGSYAYYFPIKVRRLRLAIFFCMLALVGVIFTMAGNSFVISADTKMYTRMMRYTIKPELQQAVPISFQNSDAMLRAPIPAPKNFMERILTTKTLRVAVSPNAPPFSYFNQDGELVGYDVELVYTLAKTLGVKIEFITYTFEHLLELMKSNHVDVAIGGLYVTQDRLTEIDYITPYYKSPMIFIVPKRKQREFKDMEVLRKRHDLSIAILDDKVFQSTIKKLLPHANIHYFKEYNEACFNAFETGEIDAIFWTEVQARVFILTHPQLTIASPKNFDSSFFISMALPKKALFLQNYINYWLRLEKNGGLMKHLQEHWIYGEENHPEHRSWNIVHWLQNLTEENVRP